MLETVGLEDISIGVFATDWKEAIVKTSQRLLQKNAITNNYISSMIKVIEKTGPYIVLTKGIALAHTRPEEGALKMGLCFSTLNPPVSFGHEDFDPIELIITFSATDSNSHVELLAELADVLIDDIRVRDLIKAKSRQEFYRLLIDK